MSEAYECTECLRIFDKEEAYGLSETNYYEAGGVPFRETGTIDCCPYCGSDTLDTIRLCDKCELNPVADAREDWCKECLGKHVKSLEPLDQWMTDFRDELNGMVPR